MYNIMIYYVYILWNDHNKSKHSSPYIINKDFSYDENFKNLLYEKLWNMQYSIINYHLHDVHYIPMI